MTCTRKKGKNKKNIFTRYQRKIQSRHHYFPPQNHRIRCINKIENPVKNTDAEEWKTATLIVGEVMVAGLRKVKL